MTQTVVGIFDTANEAQNAVERLTNSGFDRGLIDVSINNTDTRTERQVADDDRDDDSFGERVSRFFRSLFDSDEETEKYSRVAREGGAIVTVQTTTKDEAEHVAEILDECGAVDVDERAKSYGTRYSERTADAVSSSDDRSNRLTDQDMADKSRSIPIIEEELRVGKREVERGGVRIRSRIVERPVEETVRLREERVNVNRNPVNRPATEGELNTFREGEMEIKQRAEVPVVNKEARIVEEINIDKDVREREETIRDTVRRTEVEIDETDADDETEIRKNRRTDNT
jgi:stress response protein YsnF